MPNKEKCEVQIGDIYQDRDKRKQGRKFQVTRIEENNAFCVSITANDGTPAINSKTTCIKTNRFHTSAYQWLENAPLKTDATEQS